MLGGVNLHQVDSRPDAHQRMMDDMEPKTLPGSSFGRGTTALSKGMSDIQEMWLLHYACNRWFSLHMALTQWRAKMRRFERMAEDDYSDRRQEPDERSTDAVASIFARQNHTLGLVNGFSDFTYSQARDDIFGTRPWLAATPEGPAADDLADKVTKNAQWKLNQSNIEPTLLDAIRSSIDLGTSFVSLRWIEESETSEDLKTVAIQKSTGEPILGKSGDYISNEADLPDGMDPLDLDWQDRLIENASIVQNNIEASLIDYNNIAFEPTASEMNLRYTDVFHRFKMGVHDLVATYGLSEAQRDQLIAICNSEPNETARTFRDETATRQTDSYKTDSESNPEVWLVEGFMRCDPLKTGRAARLHLIFSPMLNAMFRCDYLANVTPGGALPVFPVRCFKITNRILGRGYYERYEDANTAIDAQYNAVTLRNRTGSEIIKTFKRSALLDEAEGQDMVMSPDKLYELKEDKTIKDLFEFAVIPDANNRAIELLNQMMQMAQMRTGITSAAQGELKGMPQNNTATGVNQMISRGAVLLKWPIDQITDDLTKAVDLAVHFHFANLDEDEAFTWGEGKDSELIELKSEDVQGMKMKVSLTLTRAQNQSKLQNAQAGIGVIQAYSNLPEVEKASPRRVFVQALASLGFDDADNLVRQAVVDPKGIMALLPPNLQPTFNAFLQSQGLAPAPASGDPNAAGQVANPDASTGPGGVPPDDSGVAPVTSPAPA